MACRKPVGRSYGASAYAARDLGGDSDRRPRRNRRSLLAGIVASRAIAGAAVPGDCSRQDLFQFPRALRSTHAFTRWSEACVCGVHTGRIKYKIAVVACPRLIRAAHDYRQRRRRLPVLVTGWQFHRIFRGGKTQRIRSGYVKRDDVVRRAGAPEGREGAWSSRGVILFGARADGLFRADAVGGKAVRLTTLDPKQQETSHRWPQFLPDQKHFLYVSKAPTNPPAHLVVASLDSPQGKTLAEDLGVGIFSGGYLFYMQESDLLARRFDPDRLQLIGESTVLARQVQSDPQFNFGAFSVVPSVLTYQTGAVAAGTRIVEIDRTGKQQILWREAALLQNIALSPNGDQIAADIGLSAGQLTDLWIYNLPKHTNTRLTFDQFSSGPVWSPDGKQIAFSRQTGMGSQIVIKNVSGSGDEQVVINENEPTLPFSWSSDGRYLLYRLGLTLLGQVKVVALKREHKAVKLLDIKSTAGAALYLRIQSGLLMSRPNQARSRIYMSCRSTLPTTSVWGKENGKSPVEGVSHPCGVATARKCTSPAQPFLYWYRVCDVGRQW